MQPHFHKWVVNNVALSYGNCFMGILPHLYGCLVIISRIIEAIPWLHRSKRNNIWRFLPSQLVVHKVIFHYSESKQINLNIFACTKFWAELRREVHWCGRSQFLKKKRSWERCPTHGDSDVPRSPAGAASPFALNPQTRRGGHVTLNTWWWETPPFPPFPSPNPVLCPPSLPLFPVRTQPGSNTNLWDGRGSGREITCFDCSYPLPQQHRHTVQIQRAKHSPWSGSCGPTQAIAKPRLSSQIFKPPFQ